MEPVGTPEEAKAKIDYWVSRGAAAVKIYASMRGDIMRAVINYAHQRGVRVNGHIEFTPWGEAIDMGIDVLHHGILAMREVMPEGIPDQAIGMVNFAPPEYDRFYQAIIDQDLRSPKFQAVFKAAARSNVVFVPTVAAITPSDAVKDHMAEQQPFYASDAWKKVEGRFNAEKRKYAVLLSLKNIEFVREANKAGVMLSTGTDLTNLQILPGWSLHREMELFADAGMSPMEVLRAATYNGAFAIGKTDSLGSIGPGKLADMVVLNSNPLENISNIRSVYRIIKAGTVYVPDDLLRPIRGRIH
jgi:imidazolonepropionase-like amidohydrolase